MSKGVLINTLNTYIGTALYEEFLGKNPEESEYTIYGTYYEKDSSEKPLYVKKMMKRSKPVLFRSYMLERMDYYIYDMNSGRLDDLEFAIKNLTKDPLESEKTLVVISSVLEWAGNQHKIVEDKPEPKEEDNIEEKQEENKEQIDMPKEIKEDGEEVPEDEKLADDEEWEEKEVPDEENEEDDEDNNKKMKIIKVKRKKKPIEIKYKRIGYSEEEFKERIPIDSFAKIKKFEDHIMNLKHENLNIYVVCAGIPYGNAETVFNYFFKSAWLQSPEELPYINSGENLIPTIHVKDLAKIIKMVLEKKPEQKYIFAIDQTEDKSLKNLVLSISREIGTGKTKTIEYKKDNPLRFSTQDFFIDNKKITEPKKLNLLITNNELNWQEYLKIDVLLKPSKFIEEEFEWYCKEGIPKNIRKNILKEFCLYRKLRPIKIILNCSNRELRESFASKISKFYNIPVINHDKIINLLSIDENDMNEEELYMKQKYLFLKNKLENLNPDDKNERNELLMTYDEILLEAFKYCLGENECINRGYILEGFPSIMSEINQLYFKKVEIKEEINENMEEMEEAEEIEDQLMEEQKNLEMEKSEEPLNEDNEEAEKKSINMEGEDYVDNPEDKENEDNKENEDKKEILEVKKKPKKIKIIPKKYKTIFDKQLLPESVISIFFNNQNGEIDNVFWEVERFYQENSIEVLNLMYEENEVELFETIRIYVERNGRPFNYFEENEDNIHEKRILYLKNNVREKDKKEKLIAKELENKKLDIENDYWMKMEKRIEDIKKEKNEIEQYACKLPTRKFLLLNIMPILTKGMLEVCKINPIDPIDYLADILFREESNDMN